MHLFFFSYLQVTSILHKVVRDLFILQIISVPRFHQRLITGNRSLPLFPLSYILLRQTHIHTQGSTNDYFFGSTSAPNPKSLYPHGSHLPASPSSSSLHQKYLHLGCPAFLIHGNRWDAETKERKGITLIFLEQTTSKLSPI